MKNKKVIVVGLPGMIQTKGLIAKILNENIRESEASKCDTCKHDPSIANPDMPCYSCRNFEYYEHLDGERT